MVLTVADIERWDAGSVREVFHAATSHAQAAQDAANGLATLPAFSTWGGVAAEAAKEAIGKTRRDLDAHGQEALAVANAARTAADEIEQIKSELATVKADAESLGMEIDSATGQVLPGRSIRDPMEALLKEQQLQPRLDKIVAEANMVDIALANAIHMADGTVPTPASAQASGAGPTPSGQGLSTGSGGPNSAGKTGGQPTDLEGALDRIAGVPVPACVPRPVVFSAEEIEGFKTAARAILQREGMPSEQIEPYLSGMVARAQAMGRNFPENTPPEPARVPAPGFGEGFGDAWRNTEQGIKNLLGQGGPGAPGVLESWKGVATGISDAATNPVGTAIGEVQHALDSPSLAYYAGEKAFDVASAAATAPFGAEGAMVRAGLPAELVTEGGIPLSVMRGWNPLGGMHSAEFDNLFGPVKAL